MHTPEERRILLDVAAASVRHGLETGHPLPIRLEDYPESLREPGATFVTLNLDGRLRGCIGSLQPIRPLVEDVAENAFAAAFRDPRFPPVTDAEYPRLDYHISILNPPEPMTVASEADLLRQLRPGVDGLVLIEGNRRATFLPSVWEQLPDPRQFLANLKIKASLPVDYWSDTLRFERYTVEEFGSQDVNG